MQEIQEYKTTTIIKRLGACGNIYCLFMEDEGAFHKLKIHGDAGKQVCGGCWLDAVGRILTYALRRGIWEGSTNEGIINQMLHIRCNSLAVNAEHLTSCSDAIAKSIKEYLRLEEPKDTLQEATEKKI